MQKYNRCVILSVSYFVRNHSLSSYSKIVMLHAHVELMVHLFEPPTYYFAHALVHHTVVLAYFIHFSDGFDLKFPSTRNHSAKGDDSSSLDKVSICFWCKTSQVKAPFLSYENNGHPPSLLNLVYSDGYVTLQINNKTA